MSIAIVQTVTSVHVGGGAAIGAVDLPVSREPQTQWPFIPGSSWKGALRSRAGLRGCKQQAIAWAFGREAQHGTPQEEHADSVEDSPKDEPKPERGKLRLRSAILLAVPVRSLKGTFVLLTSPLALGRLAREVDDAPDIPVVTSDRVVFAPGRAAAFQVPLRGDAMKLEDDNPELAPLGYALLEDLDWLSCEHEAVGKWADFLKKWVGDQAPLTHLAVVHDDIFQHAVSAWLPVRARAAIHPETGVVQDGQLFTTESLPPETLLWTHQPTVPEGWERLNVGPFDGLLPAIGEVWVVGGQQSVGMGRVTWFGRSNDAR